MYDASKAFLLFPLVFTFQFHCFFSNYPSSVLFLLTTKKINTYLSLPPFLSFNLKKKKLEIDVRIAQQLTHSIKMNSKNGIEKIHKRILAKCFIDNFSHIHHRIQRKYIFRFHGYIHGFSLRFNRFNIPHMLHDIYLYQIFTKYLFNPLFFSIKLHIQKEDSKKKKIK